VLTFLGEELFPENGVSADGLQGEVRIVRDGACSEAGHARYCIWRGNKVGNNFGREI
jgi:hypothetical protein